MISKKLIQAHLQEMGQASWGRGTPPEMVFEGEGLKLNAKQALHMRGRKHVYKD